MVASKKRRSRSGFLNVTYTYAKIVNLLLQDLKLQTQINKLHMEKKKEIIGLENIRCVIINESTSNATCVSHLIAGIKMSSVI